MTHLPFFNPLPQGQLADMMLQDVTMRLSHLLKRVGLADLDVKGPRSIRPFKRSKASGLGRPDLHSRWANGFRLHAVWVGDVPAFFFTSFSASIRLSEFAKARTASRPPRGEILHRSHDVFIVPVHDAVCSQPLHQIKAVLALRQQPIRSLPSASPVEGQRGLRRPSPLRS